MSRKCMFVGACLVDPKFPSNVYADICTVYLERKLLLNIPRPPVPVGVDAQGRQIPGEVPKLFGGDIVEYIVVRDMYM